MDDVDFSRWVRAQPKSLNMLLGKEKFVFEDPGWKAVDDAFQRLKRVDIRYSGIK